MIYDDPGDIPIEDLMHYGVKGMKWGVIRKRKSSGSSGGGKKEEKSDDGGMTEVYKKLSANPKPRTAAEKSKAAADNQAKFLAKAGIDPDEVVAEKLGWRPTKEQVAWTLAGAAVVGVVAYGAYVSRPLEPGGDCKATEFLASVTQSKSASWIMGPFVQPSSYDQKEFTLPKGHTFHRISQVAESGFNSATYATSNTDDYNRYLTAFRKELSSSTTLQHITFKATADIKVPDLTTRLETLRSVLADEDGFASPDMALSKYNEMSGGSWKDSTSQKFFKALGDKGYGAIIDDMDAGVIGESPLVIFKPDLMSEKVAKKISARDIKTAELSLKEIMNRKRAKSFSEAMEDAKKQTELAKQAQKGG